MLKKKKLPPIAYNIAFSKLYSRGHWFPGNGIPFEFAYSNKSVK